MRKTKTNDTHAFASRLLSKVFISAEEKDLLVGKEPEQVISSVAVRLVMSEVQKRLLQERQVKCGQCKQRETSHPQNLFKYCRVLKIPSPEESKYLLKFKQPIICNANVVVTEPNMNTITNKASFELKCDSSPLLSLLVSSWNFLKSSCPFLPPKAPAGLHFFVAKNISRKASQRVSFGSSCTTFTLG